MGATGCEGYESACPGCGSVSGRSQPHGRSCGIGRAAEAVFVTQLQQAVRTNDKVWLAEHVQYPCGLLGRAAINSPQGVVHQEYASLIGAKLARRWWRKTGQCVRELARPHDRRGQLQL